MCVNQVKSGVKQVKSGVKSGVKVVLILGVSDVDMGGVVVLIRAGEWCYYDQESISVTLYSGVELIGKWLICDINMLDCFI